MHLFSEYVGGMRMVCICVLFSLVAFLTFVRLPLEGQWAIDVTNYVRIWRMDNRGHINCTVRSQAHPARRAPRLLP